MKYLYTCYKWAHTLFSNIKDFFKSFRKVEQTKPIVYQKVCSQCARPVVPEVVAYCLRHPSRFEGKIYCKEHQYPFFNNMPGLENQLEKQAKIFAKESVDYD